MANKSREVKFAFVAEVNDFVKGTAQANKALGDIGKDVDADGIGFAMGDAIGSGMLKGLAALGTTAVLAEGLFDAFDVEAAAAATEVRFGQTADEAVRTGEIAAEIYADGWGQSLGEVNDNVARVGHALEDLTDLTDDELAEATTQLMQFAEVFEVDIQDAIVGVETLLSRGMVDSAEEANDVLVKLFQELGPRGDDALETLREYGPIFEQIGIDGEEFFAIMDAGLDAGLKDTDQVADAWREMTIRIGDGSASEALEQVGIDFDLLQQAFAEGGPAADAAFDQVVNAILSIEDPVQQMETAVAVFGTKVEDNGIVMVEAMAAAQGGVEGVAGAADAMSETLGETAQSKIDAFTNKLDLATIEMTEAAVPAFGALADAGSGALDMFLALPDEIQGAAGMFAGITGAALPAADAIGEMGANLALISTTGVGKKLGALAKSLGPLGMTGIGLGLTGAFVGLTYAVGQFGKSEREAAERARKVNEALDGQVGKVGEATDAWIEFLSSDESEFQNQIDDLGRMGMTVQDLDRALADGDAGLKRFIETAVASGEITLENGYAVEDLVREFDNLVIKGDQITSSDGLFTRFASGNEDLIDSFEETQQGIADTAVAMTELRVASEDLSPEQGKIVDQMQYVTEAYDKGAISTAEYVRIMGDLDDEYEGATQAAEDAATSSEAWSVVVDGKTIPSTEDLDDAVSDLNDEIEDYWDLTQRAAGGSLDLAVAEDEMREDVAAANEVIKDGESSLADKRAATQDARDAIRDYADEALRVAEDQAELNGETLTAKERIRIYNQALDDGARGALPRVRTQVQGLKLDLDNLPTSKTTDINVTGVDEANGLVDGWQTNLAAIPANVLTTITVQGVQSGFDADGNYIGYADYADGGTTPAGIYSGQRYVTFAEGETGGEAFIPLTPSKRPQALRTFAETADRLGVSGMGGGDTVVVNVAGDVLAEDDLVEKIETALRRRSRHNDGLNW